MGGYLSVKKLVPVILKKRPQTLNNMKGIKHSTCDMSPFKPFPNKTQYRQFINKYV